MNHSNSCGTFNNYSKLVKAVVKQLADHFKAHTDDRGITSLNMLECWEIYRPIWTVPADINQAVKISFDNVLSCLDNCLFDRPEGVEQAECEKEELDSLLAELRKLIIALDLSSKRSKKIKKS